MINLILKSEVDINQFFLEEGKNIGKNCSISKERKLIRHRTRNI